MPREHTISVLSVALWWAKLEKNDKVRHNMTQILCLLVMHGYCFYFHGLWSAFYGQRGAYMQDKTTYHKSSNYSATLM